jgi:preprotein translocase subunit YajC
VQDAVLQLASSAMFIYKAPTLSLSLILLMIIIFVIAFALIYLYWKEKKEKRPKLLKELSETT